MKRDKNKAQESKITNKNSILFKKISKKENLDFLSKGNDRSNNKIINVWK